MPPNDKKPGATEDHTQPKPATMALGSGEARLPHEGLRQADGSIEGRDVFNPKDKGENYTEGSQEDLAAKQLAGEKFPAAHKGAFRVIAAVTYYPVGSDLSDPHKLPPAKRAKPGDIVSDLTPEDAAQFFARKAIEPTKKSA